MNAFAQAWHDAGRAQPTNVAEMESAKQLASKHNVDYCDALDEVRRQYAEQQSRSQQ